MSMNAGVDLEQALKVAMHEHEICNGCEFAPGAFERLTKSLGFQLLADALEEEEISCPHKLTPARQTRPSEEGNGSMFGGLWNRAARLLGRRFGLQTAS